MNDTIKQVIEDQHKYVESVREILRESGVSESDIMLYTINLPAPEKMRIEDTLKFYEDVKKLIVIYLNNTGFSVREIARRLGGHTESKVQEIITEYKSSIQPHDKPEGI